MLVEPADAPLEKHCHARFDFADGDPQLRFVDQRTFGGLALSPLGPDGIPEAVAHIAPDPFEAAYDQAAVVRRMKLRDSAVKRALLDQTLVSGIGNIYADEALWRAKVHGERLLLGPDQADPLAGPRPRPRGHVGGARPRRHELRRALRQRQRCERLLRPVAARLRPGGHPVRPLRRD